MSWLFGGATNGNDDDNNNNNEIRPNGLHPRDVGKFAQTLTDEVLKEKERLMYLEADVKCLTAAINGMKIAAQPEPINLIIALLSRRISYGSHGGPRHCSACEHLKTLVALTISVASLWQIFHWQERTTKKEYESSIAELETLAYRCVCAFTVELTEEPNEVNNDKQREKMVVVADKLGDWVRHCCAVMNEVYLPSQSASTKTTTEKTAVQEQTTASEQTKPQPQSITDQTETTIK